MRNALDPYDPGGSCDDGTVLFALDLRALDAGECEDIPVARYLDDDLAAILWLTRSGPIEQSLNVYRRAASGEVIDSTYNSGGSDWDAPTWIRSGGVWLSGFSMTGPLPDGRWYELTTGVRFTRPDAGVGEGGRGWQPVPVESADGVGGAFIERVR